MADSETLESPGAGLAVGKKPGLYRGTFKSALGALVAPLGLVFVGGAEDAHTFVDATGDAANGLDVDCTRVPADPFGVNADAAIAAGAAGSIQAKLRLMTTQLDAIQTSLQALDNGIAGNEFQVDIVSGGLTITRPATVAVTTPATSTSSGTLIASNANRLGLEITNKSTSHQLHVRRGAAAATEANSTIVIDPLTTWVDTSGYTGEIRGILAAGAGASTAAVAEFTA